MHQTKRILSLLLVMIMMVTVLAFPASAEETMQAKFAAFPQQSSSSYSSGYTRAVQAYLCSVADHTLALIRNSGGIDGVYGSATSEGVKWIQENCFSISVTGTCNSATWQSMGGSLLSCGTMTDSGTGHTYSTYGLWDGAFYRTRTVDTKTEFSVFNVLAGSGWVVFRTA